MQICPDRKCAQCGKLVDLQTGWWSLSDGWACTMCLRQMNQGPPMLRFRPSLRGWYMPIRPRSCDRCARDGGIWRSYYFGWVCVLCLYHLLGPPLVTVPGERPPVVTAPPPGVPHECHRAGVRR